LEKSKNKLVKVMSNQITITLPDEVYKRAEHFARLANRGLASILADTIQFGIPSISTVAAAFEPISAEYPY
jgi:predicted DNA-binding protein